MSEKIRLEANEDDVRAIKEWLKAQPHLPDTLDEIVIRRFLFSCKQSLQITKTTMDLFFTIRNCSPEIFSNRDPLSSEVIQANTVFDYVSLPTVTKDNYRVVMTRLTDFNPDHYNYTATIRSCCMLMDTRILTEEPLSEGDVLLIDCTGFTLKHFTKWVLSIARVYMKYTQEALPLKLRQVHIINCNPIVDKIFTMLKPMLHDDVRKSISFHLPGSDTLYKHVPKEILPKEYGGDAGNFEDLKKTLIDKMNELREFFLDDELWKVDETKRPNEDKKNININEGSFRSLCID